MRNCMTVAAVAALVLVCVSGAQADKIIDLAQIGNPGNANDTHGDGGAAHTYNIGKYEVTAGQYTEFLNAAADTDQHGMYNSYMDYDAHPDCWGCNIKRSGLFPDYTYSVDSSWPDQPVNHVSWGDAARFANRMHSGQGSGDTGTCSRTAVTWSKH